MSSASKDVRRRWLFRCGFALCATAILYFLADKLWAARISLSDSASIFSKAFRPASSLQTPSEEPQQLTAPPLSDLYFSVPPFHHDVDHLSRQDACAAAIPGTTTDMCGGVTLCCVRQGSAFPQCQVILGLNFCCVEQNGSCYTDMESQCGTPNAVSCTHLTAGTTQACCPELTICAPNFNHSDSDVRCQVQPNSTVPSATTASLSTSPLEAIQTLTSTVTNPATVLQIITTSTSSSSSSSSSSSLPPPAVATPVGPSISQDSTTLTGGGIAGIAVGSGLFLLIASALLSYLIHRRRRRHHHASQGPATHEIDSNPSQPPGTNIPSSNNPEAGPYEFYAPAMHELPSTTRSPPVQQRPHPQAQELDTGP